MVSYNYLSRKDRMALVHVVRAFGAFDHGPEDPQALGALAKGFASPGELIPNRIPVSAAIERLIQEFKRVPPLATGSSLLQDSLADLQDKPSPSYVVAHDKLTGREVWKKMRMTEATAEPCDSYITPILRRAGGRLELVVVGGLMLDAYDPATGKQQWYLPDLVGGRTITGPVAAHGMIFATQGMRQPL